MTGCWKVSHGSTKENKWKVKLRFITQVLEEVHCTLGGTSLSRVRQRVGQDLGHIPVLGSVCRVPWGSRVKGRFVNSNQNVWGFGELPKKSYLRDEQEEGPGRWGRVLIKRASSENHIRNLYL